MTKTAVFTPTRHPGINVSAYSVLRQTVPVDYWLIADQLDRDNLIRAMMPPPRKHPEFRSSPVGPEIITHHAPVKEGYRGNLAQVSNWALDIAQDLQVDLLIFLQDYIWAPPDGVERFLDRAEDHPFALLTGTCHMSEGPNRLMNPAIPEWAIVHESQAKEKPPEPWLMEPRVEWGFRKGRVSNHAWEINWGALPYSIINSGHRFDEDYDKGTQWENTQFSFDVSRDPHIKSMNGGYVWWDDENVACGLPHRDYFPKTHEGERTFDNGEMFWQKNPDLVGVR